MKNDEKWDGELSIYQDKTQHANIRGNPFYQFVVQIFSYKNNLGSNWEEKQKSETKVTASVIKQNPNTPKVTKNAYFNFTHYQTCAQFQ